MGTHEETERKFDVDPGRPLPDLVGGPVASVGEPVVTHLEATYLDTASLGLAAARVTLRRRTGGDDAGWHLKLPKSGDTRIEVHQPLGRGTRTVPAVLLDHVRAVVRDHPLAPVAVLRTMRVERHLLGPDGADVAVLADDTVEGTRLAPVGTGVEPTTMSWRELEVELVSGHETVLDAVTAVLAGAGIDVSSSSSKLSRVLGPGPAAVRPDPSARAARGSVGTVLHHQLAEQVGRLLAEDRGARAGDEDAVHDLRVAARRLRSLLATYRPVLDREVTDPLRAELRWLGGEVGAAQEAQVQRERVAARLEVLPRDLVLGPVRRRSSLELQAQVRVGLVRLRAALASSRYYRLLDALDGLAADPPLTRRAGRADDAVVPRLVGRQVRRVRRAAGAVSTATDETARETALLEVRKAAKRARDAAESAAPVVGKPAKRLASRMEDLQELLGEHQDAVTARALHRELGVAAYAAGENGFTFGVLRAEEDAVTRSVRARYPEALRRATGPKAAGWTGR